MKFQFRCGYITTYLQNAMSHRPCVSGNLHNLHNMGYEIKYSQSLSLSENVKSTMDFVFVFFSDGDLDSAFTFVALFSSDLRFLLLEPCLSGLNLLFLGDLSGDLSFLALD